MKGIVFDCIENLSPFNVFFFVIKSGKAEEQVSNSGKTLFSKTGPDKIFNYGLGKF